MRAPLIALVVILGLPLARAAFILVPASGAFDAREPVLAARCERLEIAPGTEDLLVDRDRSFVFVSAADRRSPDPARGDVYGFGLDRATTPAPMTAGVPRDFQPHGMSLWTRDDGSKRLFVINHPRAGGHAVEIYDLHADGLVHVRSVAFDSLASPNDLVAVGDDQFYATNSPNAREGGLGAMAEVALGLPLNSVVFWDGERGRVVADGLTYANGISAGSEGQSVYVAEMSRRRVRVFERDTESGALRSRRTVAVPTGPDNIDVAPDGTLWIGGHPNLFGLLAYARDESRHTEAQVVTLDPATGSSRSVFVARDGEISASSVGVRAGETLLVGSALDAHVLVCPLGSDRPS